MWRLTKAEMKAEGGRRKRNRQTLEQRQKERERERGRESLELGYNLSVTLYPSNHAAIQTNPDRRSHHTHKHTHCICVIPDPLSPHFERLKTCLSKGPVPDILLQPCRRMWRTDAARLCERRGVRTTKRIKKPPELTDVHDAFRLCDIYNV